MKFSDWGSNANFKGINIVLNTLQILWNIRHILPHLLYRYDEALHNHILEKCTLKDYQYFPKIIVLNSNKKPAIEVWCP